MSAANVPEGLKNITPFLQRAAQLQERDPVVSYYGKNGCISHGSRCKRAKTRCIVTDAYLCTVALQSTTIANYYAAKLAIAKASKDNRAFIDELLNVLEKVRVV